MIIIRPSPWFFDVSERYASQLTDRFTCWPSECVCALGQSRLLKTMTPDTHDSPQLAQHVIQVLKALSPSINNIVLRYLGYVPLSLFPNCVRASHVPPVDMVPLRSSILFTHSIDEFFHRLKCDLPLIRNDRWCCERLRFETPSISRWDNYGETTHFFIMQSISQGSLWLQIGCSLLNQHVAMDDTMDNISTIAMLHFTVHVTTGTVTDETITTAIQRQTMALEEQLGRQEEASVIKMTHCLNKLNVSQSTRRLLGRVGFIDLMLGKYTFRGIVTSSLTKVGETYASLAFGALQRLWRSRHD